MIAANMFEQKLETNLIAASLAVDDQTVRRWRRSFMAGGRDALLASKHHGRPPRMTQQQKQQLTELLIKAPADCGFPRHHLWTQQLIADLIHREFGIRYHHDHVGVILHAIGFTHQKPMRRAKERDEARIETWRTETWPQILKKTPQVTVARVE
jgi:transposase